MQIFHTLSTLALVLLISFLMSHNKKKINYKIVLLGVIVLFIFALLLFKIPMITQIFLYFNKVLEAISESTNKAAAFAFGGLVNPPEKSGLGYILAFQGFPILITISALSAVLTYWKILPIIIGAFSFVFKRILRIGGTLGFAVSANVFSGMSETPLVINAYLKRLSHSEIFSLMVCGTSAVASSVMILYSIILKPIVENPLGHIITSVLLTIPMALTVSRIIIPETEKVSEGQDANFSSAKNTLDAIYTGIMDGGKVIITIIAMLIGFVALIDVLNQFIHFINPTEYIITIQKIMGWIMCPVVWVVGIPWQEAQIAGSLLGTKLALNEIIAFQELVNHSNQLSHNSIIMMIYTLSSFANIGSIGIMIGVYGVLVPERKNEVLKLGVKAIIAGTLVNLSVASVVGLFL
ncbi:MAG: CNT family concentrative nucleoside transporter [Candidatus Midichloriaceae bacterium]|jgi:CNT family concentrative nucleoside transporter